jgi:hypothetical protein
MSEDEILRTERVEGNGSPTADGPAPGYGRGTRLGEGERERSSGSGRGSLASGPDHETYRGWLPPGVLLTPGEVLSALFVAEIGWWVATVVLASAGRLAKLPEPVVGHCFAWVLVFGLACGLYALGCLRSRRMAWRKQLKGKP